MEHSIPMRPDSIARSWRTATLIASSIAALELVLILILGIALLGKPISERMRDTARDRSLGVTTTKPATKPKIESAVPRLARSDTTVIVLNGNGVSGAAHAAASRVEARGYAIGHVGNAQRTDYSRSIVMYRPGRRGEGLRLARDLGIRIVGPLDGMTTRELMGAHAAVIIGG